MEVIRFFSFFRHERRSVAIVIPGSVLPKPYTYLQWNTFFNSYFSRSALILRSSLLHAINIASPDSPRDFKNCIAHWIFNISTPQLEIEDEFDFVGTILHWQAPVTFFFLNYISANFSAVFVLVNNQASLYTVWSVTSVYSLCTARRQTYILRHFGPSYRPSTGTYKISNMSKYLACRTPWSERSLKACLNTCFSPLTTENSLNICMVPWKALDRTPQNRCMTLNSPLKISPPSLYFMSASQADSVGQSGNSAL